MVSEKVLEPVSVKFGIGKKSRYRYWKNLVPKKVPVSVSEIFGTGKSMGIVEHFRYRHTLVHIGSEHGIVIHIESEVITLGWEGESWT